MIRNEMSIYYLLRRQSGASFQPVSGVISRHTKPVCEIANT